MRWFGKARRRAGDGPVLQVSGLNVFYGRAHAVQDVSFELARGVLAIVGRNGMGKTSVCNAITGLVPAQGSIRLAGEEIRGLPPNAITERGIGYVPQGRRVWPSLTVDEHLRLAAGAAGAWDAERVYQFFPRLAERKHNGGAQLSGGEQQMLAIARALLFNPRLLVMDEPTEGLAPVIVQQVADMLKRLAAEGEIAVLLIEQNLGVALDVADHVAIMVNGRIARSLPAAQLAGDAELQQRLLGVGRSTEGSAAETDGGADRRAAHGDQADESGAGESGQVFADQPVQARVFTIKRAGTASDGAAARGATTSAAGERTVRDFTRWNVGDPSSRTGERALARPEPGARDTPAASTSVSTSSAPPPRQARVVDLPVAATAGRAAYVVGTFDTKGRELMYLRQALEKAGLRVVTVDLATSGRSSSAQIAAREVARHHPSGERAVFTGDRGTAVIEMAKAFEEFLVRRRDLGGVISAGGSGGTSLVTQAMRRLPIGVPKMMVSTVASGDVRPYVGPADICMMYSVTDVSGVNRISERVLANAAHALAGMIAHAPNVAHQSNTKPAIGLTMFGVTTPCVQAVTKQLEAKFDCIVFHATGTGGQSMEKLIDSGLISGVIDVTTTEIADELVGGVLSAGPERLDAIIASRVPYVGSCGALDMVNFWAADTVPAKFRGRNLYQHNANVTLMRTTADECERIGQFIADKLNRMDGPVRFLIPDKGVSMIDAEGQPFWDPGADRALFDAIAGRFRAGAQRKLIRLPLHLNDPEFAAALVAQFNEIYSPSAGAGQAGARRN